VADIRVHSCPNFVLLNILKYNRSGGKIMEEKIEVIKYTYDVDNEVFIVYQIENDDMINFYIERKDYGNLYHCVGIYKKDKPNNIKELIDNNLDSWIFIVMNETEED
jgi:hypothetical protein